MSNCACVWFSTWSGPILSLRVSCLSILSLRHWTTLLFCSDEKASRLNRHSVLYKDTQRECVVCVCKRKKIISYYSLIHLRKSKELENFYNTGMLLKARSTSKETSVSCAIMLEYGIWEMQSYSLAHSCQCVCMCEVLSGRWADGWVDECVCSSEQATSFRHVYSGEKEQL